MFDRGFLMAMLTFLLLLVAVVYSLSRVSHPNLFRALFTPSAAPPSAATVPVTPAPKTNARHRILKPLTRARDSAPDSLPITTYVLTVSVPPFPKAADIQPGMTGIALFDKFGPPIFSSSWAEAGKLNESCIYMGDQQATVVLLQEHRVVASRTDPTPAVSRFSADIPLRIESSIGVEK